MKRLIDTSDSEEEILKKYCRGQFNSDSEEILAMALKFNSMIRIINKGY